MRIIRPTKITDANLTSSSVPETDHPAWASGATYALGDKVIRGHRRWESAAAGNIGHDPLLGGTYWTDLGATNRWKMFDDSVGSVTTATGSMTVVLAPGQVDAVALLGLSAKQATVEMTVGGGLVYSSTQRTAISGTSIDNWYSWFFEPLGARTKLVFDDLPSYAGGVVTVTIEGEGPGSVVGCGSLLIGRQFQIGTTLAGADLGINDFSKKDTDAFGVTTVIERTFSSRFTVRVAIQSSRATAIFDELAKRRATPILWLGEDEIDVLTVFGFFKNFSIDLQSKTGISYVSLEVESLPA
jgi:hypothetical protein